MNSAWTDVEMQVNAMVTAYLHDDLAVAAVLIDNADMPHLAIASLVELVAVLHTMACERLGATSDEVLTAWSDYCLDRTQHV